MKSLILTTSIVLVMMSTLFAQNNAKKGDRYFDKNLFKEAIKYYRLGVKSSDKKSVNH